MSGPRVFLLVLALSAAIPCARAQLPDGHVLLGGLPYSTVDSPYRWLDPRDLRMTPVDPNLIAGTVPSIGGIFEPEPLDPGVIHFADHSSVAMNSYELMTAHYEGRRLAKMTYYTHIKSMGGRLAFVQRPSRWKDALSFYALDALGSFPTGVYEIRPWPTGTPKLLSAGPGPGLTWDGLFGVLQDDLVLSHNRQHYYYHLPTKAVSAGMREPTLPDWAGRRQGVQFLAKDDYLAATTKGLVLRINSSQVQILGWVPGAPVAEAIAVVTYDPRTGILHAHGNRVYALGMPSIELGYLPQLQNIGQLRVLSHAQPSFITYGAGCRGQQPSIPWIASTSLPALGSQSFALTLSRSPSSTPATLMFGLSKTRIGSASLPLDLTPIGLPGCALETDALWWFAGTTDAGGNARLPIPIPNDQTLAGARFTAQWAVRDPLQTSGAGLIFSEGALLIPR